MPDRPAALLLLLLGLVVAFAFLGSHGLFDPTEGRYAEVAREMIESDDFLEPTLDFQPHWTKPPLAYWTAAAGLDLLGRNAWGARFFNAVAFFLTVLAIAAIGTRLWGRRAGFVAGLVYLSSLFPALSAAVLTADTLLTLWEVLAVFTFVRFWHAESPGKSRWWARAMWICFGLGFFTKGPPALLPLLALFVFAPALTGRRRLFDPAGIVLFFAVGFWWYIVVSLRNPGLLDYFVRDEIFGRNFSDEFRRNPQWYAPFIIYLPALVFGLGPWLVEAVRGVRYGFAASRRSGTPLWGSGASARRLLILWIALPLAVLSLSKSRLPLYVLPLFAPLALAVAAAARRATNRRLIALVTVSVVLCLGARVSLPHFNRHNNAKLIHDAAVATGGPTARYALLDERRLYGVKFYFDGSIERLSAAPGQPWADRDLQSALGDMKSARTAQRLVLITHSAGADAVEAAVAGSGLRSARTRVYGREIVTVEGNP